MTEEKMIFPDPNRDAVDKEEHNLAEAEIARLSALLASADATVRMLADPVDLLTMRVDAPVDRVSGPEGAMRPQRMLCAPPLLTAADLGEPTP